MKTYKYLFLLSTLLLFISCGKNVEDLGELTYVSPSAGNSYCIYEITKIIAQPDGEGYAVGDTFCIKCCLTGPNTWPQRTTTCPKDIKFETQDRAEYEATKSQTDCTACPAGIRDGYDCP